MSRVTVVYCVERWWDFMKKVFIIIQVIFLVSVLSSAIGIAKQAPSRECEVPAFLKPNGPVKSVTMYMNGTFFWRAEFYKGGGIKTVESPSNVITGKKIEYYDENGFLYNEQHKEAGSENSFYEVIHTKSDDQMTLIKLVRGKETERYIYTNEPEPGLMKVVYKGHGKNSVHYRLTECNRPFPDTLKYKLVLFDDKKQISSVTEVDIEYGAVRRNNTTSYTKGIKTYVVEQIYNELGLSIEAKSILYIAPPHGGEDISTSNHDYLVNHYDKYGNWVDLTMNETRTILRNGDKQVRQQTSHLRREIEYY